MIKENKEGFKPEIEEIKNLEWEEQNKKYEFLLNKDYSIRDYIGDKEINLEEGHRKEGESVVIGCIDEGIFRRIPLAGSGCLFLTREEILGFIEKRKVDIITSHENCGAALVWAKRENPNKDITQEQADELLKNYIADIAKEAKITFKYIIAEEMKRPKEYHPARMIFFNNVKDYYPSGIKKIPLSFSIERFTMHQKDNVKKRLKLAINIAFGDHGFGEKFTKEEPLIIACCLNENDNSEEIKGEINEILNEMENEFKDIKNIKERIKIDYFFVPAKK
ncbi:MAG: hypothetical protein V1651_02820 [Patescibacteria group bacterium]